jgi:hypothetical protein
MIDLALETPISLTAAARSVPSSRGGKPTHISTLLRWILSGVKAPSGEVVRLEAIRLGGKWITSREALQRFAERLTPILAGSPPPTPRTQTARLRAADRAARELERVGI